MIMSSDWSSPTGVHEGYLNHMKGATAMYSEKINHLKEVTKRLSDKIDQINEAINELELDTKEPEQPIKPGDIVVKTDNDSNEKLVISISINDEDKLECCMINLDVCPGLLQRILLKDLKHINTLSATEIEHFKKLYSIETI